MNTKPRVVVAMSGGVDSSLTAALLVRQGYEVIGATMQIWDNEQLDKKGDRGCCSLSAVNDARRVAEKIGIPYYVLNFRDYFQEKVVDYFIEEYCLGRTPNPCIACNKYVKFRLFFQKAMELGADYIATGHYGRVEYSSDIGRFLLLKGIDAAKDQSYALYHLNQRLLKHFLLPLGGLKKPETREMAREFGLSVAEKPDSQEICFILDDDYKRFLREKAPTALKQGNIVDCRGNILGKHQGLPLYTVGQRKGLGIAAGTPLYVIKLDSEKNELVVGDNDRIFSSALIAKELNFISLDKLEKPLEAEVKIRYSAKPASAIIYLLSEGKIRVEFRQPQRAVTPGQSAVFYNGDIVIGGGIIQKSLG